MILVLANDDHERYNNLRKAMATVPSKYDVNFHVYTRENLEKTFEILPYDSSKKDYGYPKGHTNHIDQAVLTSYLPEMESLAEKGYVPAIVDLADIYMFGNFSVPTNYSRAFELYKRATTVSSNGHANYMLGVIYSTGMFGLVPKSKELAILYYTIAFENGDPQALLTLAYRYHNGLGVVPDCQLAHLYYSRAVEERWGEFLSQESKNRYGNQFDISIADFKGGLFGKELSESPPTYVIEANILSDVLDQYKESTDDPDLNYLAETYLDGLLNYKGDFLKHSDYKSALNAFNTCSNYKSLGDPDLHNYFRYLHKRCRHYLGIMHLKGLGVEKNYTYAFDMFNKSDSHLELGYMYENGLIDGQEADLNRAIKYYNATSSTEGKILMYKALKKQSQFEEAKFQLEIIINDPHGYRYFDPEALYEINKYWELGALSPGGAVPGELCEAICTQYFKIINLESGIYLPSLEYALNELILGNYQNALLGYLIASEQGVLPAQISAASLLIPQRPILSQLLKPSKQKMDSMERARFLSGMEYLESASSMLDVDSTIFLGDIYHNGYDEANITADHHKAYDYYTLATRFGSSHAHFNLGYMYEYGYGPANNSVDYSMAKRHYDGSLQFLKSNTNNHKSNHNTIPVNLALLRVRLKHFFSGKGDLDESSWWSALFYKPENVHVETQPHDEQRNEPQNEHQNNQQDDEDFDEMSDWYLVAMVLLIIAMLSIQMLRRGPNGQPAGNIDFRVQFVAI